jgi:stage V sporulation protein SpoVS
MKKITFLKGNALNQIMVFMCFLFFNAVQSQTTYTTTASLVSAVNAASTTGGTFVLKNGTYNNASMSFSAIATAANPIIIKSETIGGVTFTGTSSVTFKAGAAYMTLQGFVFNCTYATGGTIVKFIGNNNIRITRNDFKATITDGVSKLIHVLIGGDSSDVIPYQRLSHHNRVDHNNFHDKNTSGNFITIDGTDAQVSQYDQIDHNSFKNSSPRVTNGQEAIRMGWSFMSNSSAFTILENNLFENCDGDPEIVSVKSCDNIIRNNTFNGNYGTLSLRSGRRNLLQGNFMFGNGRPVGLAGDGVTPVYTGGLRIYGVDHVIVNNYFEGLNGTRWDAPITLTQGDAIDNGSNSNLTNHLRAERVMIANNTLVNNEHGIQIGYKNASGSSAYNTALSGVTLANNIITGSAGSMIEVIDNASISGVTFTNNLMFPIAPATQTSGTTTSIAANNVDPALVLDAATSTATANNWKATATTPSYLNPSYTNITQVPSITVDIDGQTRTSPNSTVGADYFSSATALSVPMTAATVGPYAYENIPLALTPVANFNVAGETKATTVTTALAWTAIVDSSWLSIDNASGTANGTINITASTNTTGAARSGILTVTGTGTTPVTLTINQDGPSLTLSAVSNFIAGGESKTTTVTANVAWTASIDNPSWLSINNTSGTNNGSISITATANTLTTTRTGTLTVTGSGMAPTTLTITQNGVPSGAVLINTGTNGNPVSVTATSEQITSPNSNYAINTLDQLKGTKWSDLGNTSDRGIITFDLGGTFTLESIKLATTGSGTKWYFYDIQFSTDGVNYTSAVSVESAKADQETFAVYSFTNVARYVKITGKGNTANAFSTISEIQFWGTANLSVKTNQLNNAFVVYPNPASGTINLYSSITTNATKAIAYSMDGKQVLDKNLHSSDSNYFTIDISSLQNGTYLLKILDDKNTSVGTKMIIVRN